MTPRASSTSGASPARDPACPKELADTRRDGTRPNSYVEPTDVERTALRDAVERLVRGQQPPSVEPLGFEVVPLPSWPDTVLVREKGRLRGGGAYVVRKSSSSKLLVEAPHTFFDEGTFTLGCELFQRTGARAFFINTSHRYKSAPKTPEGKNPADVAHSPTTFFHAATEGAIAGQKGLAVVQLHGFAAREVDARAVVSNGDKTPGVPWVTKAATSLAEIMGGKVLRFPEDTAELGATTNVQGIAVRRAGGRFLHVEMDDEMRRRLLAEPELRSRALDAIGSAIDVP